MREQLHAFWNHAILIPISFNPQNSFAAAALQHHQLPRTPFALPFAGMTDTASRPSSPPDDSDYEDEILDIPVPQDNGSPDAALSTTSPPAPSTKEDTIIAEHRRQFNLTAFGTTFNSKKCRAKKRAKNHRMMTKYEYNEYISALWYWNVEAGHFDPVQGNTWNKMNFDASTTKTSTGFLKFTKSASQEAQMAQH